MILCSGTKRRVHEEIIHNDGACPLCCERMLVDDLRAERDEAELRLHIALDEIRDLEKEKEKETKAA